MATGAPGNLRQLLNANSKKKPKKRRKRKRALAHRPPTSGNVPMPPAGQY
jgi:hypothetical protein